MVYHYSEVQHMSLKMELHVSYVFQSTYQQYKIFTHWTLYYCYTASTGLGPFCFQNLNSLNSSWHRFNKVLETVLRDFSSLWHHRFSADLSTANTWWEFPVTPHNKGAIVLRPSDCGGFMKPVWDNLTFVTCHVILLEAGIKRWVHFHDKATNTVCNSTQVGCGI